MPLFNNSTMTWLTAKTRVATVSGSEAYSDMLIRAGYALEEAVRHWENSRDWKYLLTSTTNVVAGTISAGTTFTPTTVSDLNRIAVGMTATGSAILTTPTTVTVVGASTLTLSDTATNGAASLTFQIKIVSGTSEYLLPTQVKKPYNARLVEFNNRILMYLDQRLLDLQDQNQTSTGVPVLYLLQNVGDTGKIKLYPGVTVADTLLVKYYRRHVIPVALQNGTTASDAETVDFPAQYQTYLLASARSIFLADKGGAPPERLQYWIQMAETCKRQAIAEDEFLPDGDQGFVPGLGAYSSGFASPNDIRPYLDY